MRISSMQIFTTGVRHITNAQAEVARAQEQISSGKRVLTLVSSRAGDTWKKAIVREGEVETVIDVTPVLRMAEEQIEGNGKPLVQFIIGRSGDVDRAVDAIGRKHVEQIRQ